MTIFYITAPPIQQIYLSDRIESANAVHLRRVTIFWNETTIGQRGLYIITVEPPTEECNSTCDTENPNWELTLAIGTAYNVTITTAVCNGTLWSKNNTPFPVLLNGTFELMSPLRVALSVLFIVTQTLHMPLSIKWANKFSVGISTTYSVMLKLLSLQYHHLWHFAMQHLFMEAIHCCIGFNGAHCR